MYVQTVLGPVPVEEIGRVHIHEHLLIDLSQYADLARMSLSERKVFREPFALRNYYDIRRNYASADDLRLDSEEDAIAELALFAEVGGQTLVDVTPVGASRDPLGLQRIALASRVHVVMGTGVYIAAFHPAYMATITERELAERFVSDIRDGAEGSAVRAGLIGEIGTSWPVHPNEMKVLRGAAQAQSRSGAALMIHPGRHPEAPRAAVAAAVAAGADPGRIVVSHVERTLTTEADMLELAATGCYVSFDLFGQESSYYYHSPIDMPNDAQRINAIMSLIEHGYGDRLLVSQDIARKCHLTMYGGEGYGHILKRVVPVMRRKGMTPEQINTLLVGNPAAVLSLPD